MGHVGPTVLDTNATQQTLGSIKVLAPVSCVYPPYNEPDGLETEIIVTHQTLHSSDGTETLTFKLALVDRNPQLAVSPGRHARCQDRPPRHHPSIVSEAYSHEMRT